MRVANREQIELGFDLRLDEVMNWLGHARYATTVDIYGHSIPTGIARTAERMEKILGGKKS